MIKVEKKKKENTVGLLKRFGKKVKMSNNLNVFKSGQYKNRNKSDLKKKQDALMREKKKKAKNKLYKLGKLG